jgi:nicotinamide riboside kinase
LISRPCKIAIAGTHSTGKTTLMKRLQDELAKRGFNPAYVHDSAVKARELGFPILRDHTFESTAWIMAEAIRLEAKASLSADVVLVDRPVPDALGYLVAALEVTGRELTAERMARLEAICAAWIGEYDLVLVTQLNLSIPIGPGRDDDEQFRIAAGQAIATILTRMAPGHLLVAADRIEEVLKTAIDQAERHRAVGQN